MFKHTAHPKRLRRSQGVALIFALITLVALMLGALALVRNTDTAALVLGNLGFKQDATQSADQATREAINWLNINSAAGMKARKNSPQVMRELVRWCRHHSGLKSSRVMRMPLKAW